MKSNASLVYGFILVVGDFLALVAAFVAAYLLRGDFSNTPVAHPIAGETYLKIFILLLPFWILFFALTGLYSNNIQEKRFVELGRLLVGSFIGLLFVTSYAYFSNRVIFPSKLVPVYGFGLAFVFLAVFRNLARSFRGWLFSYGIGITNILLVGNTKITIELIEQLADYKTSGYRIIGLVANKVQASMRYPYLKVFDDFNEATSHLNPNKIHGIVQTELYPGSSRNNQILEFAQTNHIAYRFVPGNSELFVGNIEVDLFHSVPVIAVHQTPLVGWGRVVKRLFDLVAGSIALIVASPFMLLIAIAVKLSDGGPVFFSHERLSRFDTKVTIYKLRSHKMKYSGLEPEEAFSKMGRPELIDEYRANGDYLTRDPRVSVVGRFLRRTSLDELPQLFNVVRGDISLVGPRALVAYELERYDQKNLILSVKSGLTGLAQISGRRDISFEERRQLDLYYVQNWSFWNDLVILIKTLWIVLFHRGAF